MSNLVLSASPRPYTAEQSIVFHLDTSLVYTPPILYASHGTSVRTSSASLVDMMGATTPLRRSFASLTSAGGKARLYSGSSLGGAI